MAITYVWRFSYTYGKEKHEEFHATMESAEEALAMIKRVADGSSKYKNISEISCAVVYNRTEQQAA